jgi:hypothetical protein
VLLDSLLEDRRLRVAPDLSTDDFFELFVSEQVLWDHNLSWEEIQDGVVDGGDDGGIDSVFAFLNDNLLVGGETVPEARNQAHFTVYVLQSKTSPKFSEVAVDKLRNSLTALMNLDYSLDDAGKDFNANVIAKFKQFREAYIANATKFPSVAIHVVYATRGSEVHAKVQRKAEQLEAAVSGLFSECSCVFRFVSPATLVAYARRLRPTTLDIRFAEAISTNGDSVVGLVQIEEYFKFVTSEDGALRSALFESNVRDYEGNASINASIRSTLEERNSGEDFWWLNNGVTVVASRVAQYGKRVSVEYPQIVNGLQTTREIYEAVRRVAESGHAVPDPRSVLVRVIVPPDMASRDRIIRATNSQTTIPSVALRATDKIQRDIEDYLAQHGYYYERRSGKYKNEGKPIGRIVSIPYLAECVLAVRLGRPHLGSPRVGGRFLRDDQLYREIFDPNVPLGDFLNALEIVRRVEVVLRSGRLKDGRVVERPVAKRAGRHLLFVSMAVALDQAKGESVNRVNPDLITQESILHWADLIREADAGLPKGRRSEDQAQAALHDVIARGLSDRSDEE